jgi:hypothetical protein
MSQTVSDTPRPLDRGAVVSLVLGASAILLLLNVLTGLPALLLGIQRVRRINASDGRLGGRRCAVAGIVLGVLGIVLGIVGFTGLMLLRARESAARMMCVNNLRRIGQAVNLYEHERKSYPTGTIVTPAAVEDRLSWLASLLPYLQRDEEGKPLPPPREGAKRKPTVYETAAGRLDLTKPWNATENRDAVNTLIPLFLCPSHPAYSQNEHPAPTHYVGITGLGADAATLPLESPRAGFFGYDRRITRDDLKAGATYTLCATETTLDNGPWAAAGWPTLRPVDPDTQPYLGIGRPFGGCHPGVVNLLMADSRVQFFRTDGAAADFAVLATLRREPTPMDAP